MAALADVRKPLRRAGQWAVSPDDHRAPVGSHGDPDILGVIAVQNPRFALGASGGEEKQRRSQPR